MNLLRAVLPYQIGAVLVLATGLGVRWYGASQYQAGMEQCQAAHNLAALEAFKAESEKLAGLSLRLDADIAALRAAQPKIIERYTRVEVQSPLPAGCRIDAERLQHINEAGRLANTAGQPSAAVPHGSRGDER